tara:strand:- start:1992 stop:2459 length:468 start_codon:yes stop_codon:yes gene_type:complete
MITRELVEKTQKDWGNGIVTIGTLKDDRTECEKYTNAFVEKLYSFDSGPVLFKPTKCSTQQFRLTKSEAISYFIAGENRKCIEDKGFAIQPWTAVRFENACLILEGNRALAMGNYYFTDLYGNDTKVEYTFGYKFIDSVIKIDLHHSSFPFYHDK